MTSWMDDPIKNHDIFAQELSRVAKENKERQEKELVESWDKEEVDPKEAKVLNKVNKYLEMEKLLRERDRLKQNNEALKELKRKRDAGL